MFIHVGDRVVVKTNHTGGTRSGVVKKSRSAGIGYKIEWLVFEFAVRQLWLGKFGQTVRKGVNYDYEYREIRKFSDEKS